MFFNGQYIRKAVAGSLLIALLFIHSVKLLHNHSNKQLTCKQNTEQSAKKHSDSASVSAVNADCDICSYQVTRDTDHVFNHAAINTIVIEAILNKGNIINCESSFISSSESRGPPSLA